LTIYKSGLMERRDRLASVLVVSGAVVLAGTAVLHGTGYESVAAAARGLPPLLAAAIPGLWIMFSVHLVLVGLLAAAAALRARSRLLVLGCALLPAADTLILLRFVGIFPGTFLLVTAAALLVAGAFLLPQEAP